MHFSSTEIINKKPYPRRGVADIQNLVCIQVLASKLSTNAKFQNLQDLHSRTFQGFSSTFKHLICFQAISTALKFLFQIQAFLKHAMRNIRCAHCHRCSVNPWFACLLDKTVSSAKATEPMEMLYGLWTLGPNIRLRLESTMGS